MLVAISGSQGSGKSTIINELRSLGYNTVGRKTSRSILEEWGVSLNEVNTNTDLMLKFQDEIVKRKASDEREAVLSRELWFTERTYADLFSYALVVIGKDNNYTDWVNQYYHTCCAVQQSYSKVFYLKAGHFKPVHDGVRGSNVHYSRMMDLVMQDITEQMTSPAKLNVLNTPCLDQRVSIITSQSESLLRVF